LELKSAGQWPSRTKSGHPCSSLWDERSSFASTLITRKSLSQHPKIMRLRLLQYLCTHTTKPWGVQQGKLY